MNRFERKLIMVVGASSGIGLATAQRLAREGAIIVGIGREVERIENGINTLEGDRHHTIVADVSDEEQMVEITKIGKENGGYYGMVCCAGLHEMRPFTLLKSKDLISIFNSNVLSAINCSKVVAKAPSPDGASIVWISSISAMRGTVGFTSYSSAKGALISAARVAATELAKKKIRVNVIAAGVVKTAMSDAWMGLLSQDQRDEIIRNHILGLGEPEDVADTVVFLLSSDSRWITGSTIVVDGGLSTR
jgi:NAD(P)-dependent dehydrogenase (short-subunit alcohol dehydrogenase family)